MDHKGARTREQRNKIKKKFVWTAWNPKHIEQTVVNNEYFMLPFS